MYGLYSVARQISRGASISLSVVQIWLVKKYTPTCREMPGDSHGDSFIRFAVRLWSLLISV